MCWFFGCFGCFLFFLCVGVAGCCGTIFWFVFWVAICFLVVFGLVFGCDLWGVFSLAAWVLCWGRLLVVVSVCWVVDVVHAVLGFGAMFIGCGGAFCFWAGELVCGFRTLKNLRGLRKLRPRVELHSPRGEAERLGNGAETTRPLRLGDDAFATRSVLIWNGETADLQVERANMR